MTSEDEYGFYNAAKRVWKNQDKISRALCAIHTLDYACFDKLPIPDFVCQSLYTSNRFHNELIKQLKEREEVKQIIVKLFGNILTIICV